jgi:hypothetical protein
MKMAGHCDIKFVETNADVAVSYGWNQIEGAFKINPAPLKL